MFNSLWKRCRTPLCNAPFFDFMVEEKGISTHGLKADACLFGELIFDVNSTYFHNHGGYEYARQFYSKAYQATVDIVGNEQCILSAVMHADERNRAISDSGLKCNPWNPGSNQHGPEIPHFLTNPRWKH